MRGLENIISQIKLESDIKIREEENKTAKIVEEIIEAAEKQKKEIIDEYMKRAGKKQADIAKRTQALKKAEMKNSILVKKQAIIKDISERAKNKIRCFDTVEYFEFMLKILQKFCLKEEGLILLRKDDLKRIPQSFRAELKNRSLEIKEASPKMDCGFVLVYGNIEIDCTVDELFRAKESQICDLINQFFKGEFK